MRVVGFLLIFCGAWTAGATGPCLSGAPLTVAVLDTGIDADHPLIKQTLWINPGESGKDARGRDRAVNGVDDDGNGLIDDVHGWNFLSRSADVADHAGHGTHVAGLIQKFAPPNRARFMILKYFDRSPQRRAGEAFLDALKYALRMKADVIHVSGGGYRRRGAELALLREAERRGVPVIASSGNKSPGQTDRAFYPAAYALKNIFSISATDKEGQVLSTSNLNPGRENFLEIGFRVFSLLPGRREGAMTGTSQAAGIFTGKFLARRARLCPRAPGTSFAARR